MCRREIVERGSVIIPIELLHALGWEGSEEISVSVDVETQTIVLEQITPACRLCKDESPELICNDSPVCKECARILAEQL